MALEIGDQCLSCIGQWSQYQHNVSVNPPGIHPDLWTQKIVGPKKLMYRKNQLNGRLALGLGKTDLQF